MKHYRGSIFCTFIVHLESMGRVFFVQIDADLDERHYDWIKKEKNFIPAGLFSENGEKWK